MGGKPRDGGVVAIWDSNDIMIFCDLCLKQIELVNKSTRCFSKEVWINLTVNFQKCTGRLYNRGQMKNKWYHLKKKWKLWNELKHGERGLGWNPVKKTIDASDEWWTARLKVLPQAKRFRYVGINPELEDKLQRMFGHVVVSKSNAWTPNSRSVPVESIGENEVSDEADYQVEQLVNQGNNMNECNDSGGPSGSTQVKKTVTKGEKKRKHTADSTRDELFEASHIDDHCILKPRGIHIPSCNFTMREAVEELLKYPEIRNDFDLFYFATLCLRDEDMREVFMCIRKDMKVRWITRRYEDSINQKL